MKSLLIIALWLVGTAIAFLFYKKALAYYESREGIMSTESQNLDKTDIDTTEKHFRLTFIIYCVAVLLAMIIPFKLIRWLCAIGCGMVLAPVFYDFFYNCLPKFKESKLKVYLTIVSGINFALMAITLNFLYWSYIHMAF